MSASITQRALQSRFKAMATRLAVAFMSTVTVLLAASAVADALGAPRLQSPRNKAVVQSLPAFEWGSVGRAASYEFEFSAAQNFSSTVNGFSNNPITLTNTALTSDQTIPNGTYYWRVRAVNAKDVPGRWSPIRKLVKSWKVAPKLKSPVAKTIDWPTHPLLLSWTSVAHAANYRLEIGTSPKLSTLVYGPTNVQGPQFAFPSVLAPGTYYWSVQPIDAAGNPGGSSRVGKFTWAWPSQTTLSESNVSPDSTYEEPSFSWTAIAGASSYEVQVATDPSFPVNAIILDSQNLIATTYTATNFFPNHTELYWRMRAVDANGDAGSWNDGQPFTEAFDQTSPTIQNLHVYDANGDIADGQATQDPIVRWSPVPGASEYQLTVAPWSGGGYGCNWNAGAPYVSTIDVPTTAWTPGGYDGNNAWEQSAYGWPGGANNNNNEIQFQGAGPFDECLSVIALRNDPPLSGSTIESAPVILGNGATPAFSYTKPSPGGALGAPTNATYSPGVVPAAAGSGAVPAGSTLATTPLFEWQQIAGADGYYVVIANDAGFDPNSIVTVGYTNTTAWAPSLPLKDQSSSYWWEVIPVTAGGQPESNAEGGYDPQPFNKSSIPPTPVAPTNGSNVATQPTFSWRSAQAAVSYTLQVSADPTFANPIQDINTDNTSYTSTSTLPSGKTLYWRVRANDVVNNLNWSSTETFTHNLPAPSSMRNPKAGSTIPLLSWGAVTGAIGYNLQITTAGGSTQVAVDTPYMTPPEFLNPGISHLQVQSVFPGGLTSAFTKVATYNRTLPSPGGIHATKHGTRILVTWNADKLAKTYYIQLATTTDFGTPIASDNTMNTAWVPQISAADAKLRLYWRLAAVDNQSNVGAFHVGVFNGRHAKAKHSTKKHKTKKKHKT